MQIYDLENQRVGLLGDTISNTNANSCPENCSECSNANTCTICAEGFNLVENGEAGMSVCIRTCPNGTFYNETQDECIECPLHCEICDKQGKCLKYDPNGLTIKLIDDPTAISVV